MRPRAETALRGSDLAAVSARETPGGAAGAGWTLERLRGPGGERRYNFLSRGKTTIANVYKSQRKGL